MSTSEKAVTVCGLPSSKNLKIFLLQIADEVARPVGDERVDFDVIDLNLEGGLLLRRRGCGRLTGGERGPGEQQHGERTQGVHVKFILPLSVHRAERRINRWHIRP